MCLYQLDSQMYDPCHTHTYCVLHALLLSNQSEEANRMILYVYFVYVYMKYGTLIDGVKHETKTVDTRQFTHITINGKLQHAI